MNLAATAYQPTYLKSCDACNTGRHVPGETTVTLARWATTVTLHHVPVAICDHCQHQYMDEATSSRLQELLTSAIKDGITSVTGEYLDAAQLQARAGDKPLVLIVDDFPDALEIYETYLTFNGYRVITATNGPDAISLARTHRPDLIFMDLGMSPMTGTEALAALRSDEALAATPIAALTAHALVAQRHAALAAGFDDVIVKPCVPNELVTAIDRILGARRRVM